MKKVVASALLSLITATGIAANSSEAVPQSKDSTNRPTLSTKLTYPQDWVLVSRIFGSGLASGERQYVRVDYKQYANNKLKNVGYNAACVYNNTELLELWVETFQGYPGSHHMEVNVSVCSQPDQDSNTVPPPANPTCVTMANLQVNAQIDVYGNVTSDLPQAVVDLSSMSGQPSTACQYGAHLLHKPIVQRVE